MSNFPGSLDDDSTLYIAKDNISTKSLAAQSIGDTVLVVANPAGWVANMIANIDLEQEFVTGVTGNVLTVTRGFNGTTAVAHNPSRTVSNNVDAAYQSAAKSAIIAVETALGPNLSNVASSPAIKASTYNFSPQAIGGSLSIGANTITFPSLPLGINALSVNNSKLYISGGTGAAEAVPIIGVSGSSVTVTCANTHTGAWTIQSATGGNQEAICYSCANGNVPVFLNSAVLQAGILVPAGGSPEIFGSGTSETTLTASAAFDTAGGDIIGYAAGNVATRFSMHDFAISAGAAHASGYNIAIRDMSSGMLRNIFTLGGYSGILAEGGNGFFTDNLHLLAYSQIGFYLHATVVTGGRHHGWTMSGQVGSAGSLLIEANGGGATAGLQFSDISFQQGGYGIQIYANGGVCNEIEIANVILDSNTAVGLRLIGASGGNGIHVVNLRGSMTTAPLLDVYGTFSDVSVVAGSGTSGGNSNGMVIRGGKNVTIADFNMAGGNGGVNDIALLVTTDPNTAQVTSNLRVSNCSFGFSATGAPLTSAVGLEISPAAHTGLHFSDSDFSGSTFNIADSGTVPAVYSGFVRGLSDSIPSVADAATVTFPPIAQGGTVELTGSGTAVTAVAGFYKGQTGNIQTASAITFTAGATIGTTVTTGTNSLTPFWFDGTKVWLR